MLVTYLEDKKGKMTIRILIILLFLSSACTKVEVALHHKSSRGTELGLPPLRCNPDKLSLEVESQKQENGSWCWVASAKTVLDYHGVSNGNGQCEFVTKSRGDQLQAVSDNSNFCCQLDDTISIGNKDTFQKICRSGGWPEEIFAKSSPPISSARTEIYQVLTWDALRHQLCEFGPFIYAVEWTRGGFHTGVVSGYHTTQVQGLEKFVDIDEHYGAGFLAIPYETFVRDPKTHTHYFDIINIQPSL